MREKFPAMYKDFRHYCKQQHPKTGTLWLWQGVDQGGRTTRIACLFTLDAPHHKGGHPGRAHTEHVNHALHELKKLIQKEGYQSVAVPRLATGVGGLDGAHVGIYIDFKAGVEAREPFGEQSAS